MGVAFYYSGENKKALQAYEAALKVILPSRGENHPEVATIRCNIAFVKESESKLDDALELFEKSMKVRLRTFGESHPHSADCHEGFGLVKEAQEKREEAIKHFEKSLEARIKKHGANHTDVGASYAGLALVHLNKDDFDKANEFDEKARAILGQTKGAYPLNRNPISRLRPAPPEMLRATSKSLRQP